MNRCPVYGFRNLVVLASTLIVVQGCASPKMTTPDSVDLPKAFSVSGSEPLPDRWWTSFKDDQLNAVVETALESNFSLKAAWERLREARALARREGAPRYPTLEAASRGEIGRSTDESGDFETVSVGLNTSYEVDFWGRVRSAADAEAYRAEATLADYRTASLTLSAEIVRGWYQLAEARNQLALVQEQVETNETVLRLLENRFGTGQILGVDILRQRELVASTREQASLAEAQVRVLENRLAVLLGRSPQEGLAVRPDSLPELPSVPRTGLPAELIQRRPDLLSAYHRLQAADRDVASAVSSQYPRLTISASVFSDADRVGNLFTDWFSSIAGNLLAPLFKGGELRADVQRTQAIKQQRLYEYGQATLVALQEVEDALIREAKQAESMGHLDEQVRLASLAYEQLRLQYFSGTSNYLDVLTALDDLQQLHRDRLSARLSLIEFRIELYRAIAGSFETSREAGA